MPRWRLLLGGPLVWALHFGTIYAVASVSDVAIGFTGLTARIIVLIATATCLGACVWVLTIALRQPQGDALSAFWRTVAATGAILAAIAICWQTLPALAPLEETAPLSSSL